MRYLNVACGCVVLGAIAGSAGQAAAGEPDFNGDGFADLAVGVPFDKVGSVSEAGAVHVIYGSAAGLTSAGSQLWSQDTPGVRDKCERSDQFGQALAWGDFDGDGFTDLAIGAPFEDLGSINSAGAVNVLYGSAGGLTSASNQFIHQKLVVVNATAVADEQFGWALAAGDFNGDGRDDLAVGAPNERLAGLGRVGAVYVFLGSPSGLAKSSGMLLHQGLPGTAEAAVAGDHFGYALTAADFDGDGFDDLAAGVPDRRVSNKAGAGAVSVFYGSAAGIDAASNQFWTQDAPGIADAADIADTFGFEVTSGDFNDDGFADLAIGAPFEDTSNVNSSGAVHVLFGSASGLTAAGSLFIDQAALGVLPTVADLFGYGLAAGDFDGDGRDDLAIGAPLKDVSGQSLAGVVHVLHGSAGGLSQPGQLWHQDVGAIPNAAQQSDWFGYGLCCGDYDGDGRCDLAVGTPFEDLGNKRDAGAVIVIHGSAAGLTDAGSQIWHQNSPGIGGQARQDDAFGFGRAR